MSRVKAFKSAVPFVVFAAFVVGSRVLMTLQLGDTGATLGQLLVPILAGACKDGALGMLAWVACRAGFRRAGLSLFFLLLTLQLVDLIHYRETLLRLDRTTLRYTNLSTFAAYFAETLDWKILVTALLIPLATVSAATTWRPRAFSRAITAATVSAIGAFALGYFLERGITIRTHTDTYWATLHEQNLIIAQSALENGVRALLPAPAPKRPAPMQTLTTLEKKWLDQRGLFSERSALSGGAAQRIVVILVESLARDFLPSFNSRMPANTLPRLEQVANDFVALPEVWTTSLPSYEGMYASFISRPDINEPAASEHAANGIFPTLEKAGVRTAFVHGLPRNYGGMARVLKEKIGVTRVVVADELREKQTDLHSSRWGVSDRVVLDETLAFLQQNKLKRTFVVAELMDTHPPYYRRYGEPGYQYNLEQSPLINALNWTDTCIGRFLDGLEARGLFDQKTIVFIMGDHSPTHGEYLSWVNARDYRPAPIAFLAASPRREWMEALRRVKVASQVDFAPTVLDLIGLTPPDTYWGESLMSPRRIDRAIQSTPGAFSFHLNDGTRRLDMGTLPANETAALEKWLAPRLQ